MIRHVGISCLPGRGHLYPAVAIGRALHKRGLRVTLFSESVSQSIVRDAALEFCPIDRNVVSFDYPKYAECGRNGPNTLNVLSSHCASVLNGLMLTLIRSGVEGLLVDQADLASGTVAERLGIPFTTLSFLPPVFIDDSVPPFIFGFGPPSTPEDFKRNRRANSALERIVAPIIAMVNRCRRDWGLPEILSLNGAFSRRAIVTQLPQFLDFPRANAPSHLFHTGPFQDLDGRRSISFPWSRLNGKPVIYACMGTVRNSSRRIFEAIAVACAAFDLQLVLSLGGMWLLPSDFDSLPGRPIVVHYAPQSEVLKRARLAIIHAGTNSTLECVSCGVPIVAIPVTDDQPGVAARIQWRHLGIAVSSKRVTAQELKRCIATLLCDDEYRLASNRAQAQIQTIRGSSEAADIIMSSL